MSKNNNRMSFGDYMAELSYSLKNHVLDRRRIILPLLLAAAVALTVAAALFFSIRAALGKGGRPASDASADAPAEENSGEMELNAYPEVNDLIRMYYDAVAGGDIDTIRVISRGISDREITDIQVVSRSIDHYETVDVYTKPGSPVTEEDAPERLKSWVCYASTEVVFKGYAKPVPGMQTFFVEEADGRLVINFAPADMEYINTVSLQDDVVDLSNKITADYNDMLAGDPAFAAFVEALTSGLYNAAEVQLTQEAAAAQAAAAPAQETSTDGNAGNGNQETVNPEEAGAAVTEEEVLLNGGETSEGAGETGTEGGESVSAEGGQTGTALVLESVYLRSQASTESEAITTLYPGFEVQVTGSEGEWSKITYQEMNGYIKTEFLLFE